MAGIAGGARRARPPGRGADPPPSGSRHRCRWQRGAGASSAWVEGPAGLDARALAGAAAAHGVLIEPGDVFFDDPARGRACFRLGFTAIRTQDIAKGLELLGDTIRRLPRLPI